MNTSKISRNYCFLDLETTGFDPEKDSIIEMSFIVQTPEGKEICRMDEVVFPDKSELTPFVSNLTGITQEEINQSGKNFKELLPEIGKKISNSVIIGHNIDFDINFLIANGLENLAKNPRIDTHELARILLLNEESYSLEVLTDKYQISHLNAHRAMSDVIASMKIYEILFEKIQQLPTPFLAEIRPFLQKKTNWFAKSLFLEAKGNSQSENRAKNNKDKLSNKNFELDKKSQKIIENLENEDLLVVNENYKKTVERLKSISQNKKSIIISENLSFFEDFKQFPSPEVILDPEKLKKFAENSLNDFETVFYIQSAYRNYLGFRGKKLFDLFLNQRILWQKICLNSPKDHIFEEIIAERKTYQSLVIHPQTFLKLIDLEIFSDRILLIDDGENFAKKVLFSPVNKWSFANSLNSKNEEEANNAHFWVTNFCREVIEEKIQHSIGHFPERILLQRNDHFPVFANKLQNITSLEKNAELAEILNHKQEKIVRWAIYFPEKGNLIIETWHPESWREIKNKLAKFKKVVVLNNQQSTESSFLKNFLGIENCQKLIFRENNIKLTIPNDLISNKSPHFNSFCSEKIKSIFRDILSDKEETLAVSFSSLESLKKVFYDLNKEYSKEKIVLGETVSGGNAKLIHILKNNHKKQILLIKNVAHPELFKLKIKRLIMQKFIFDPPHPLIQEIENVMKNSGLNFWSEWIIPQVSANLSRTIYRFPDLKEVVFLDARENSRWGKEILHNLF